MTVPVTAGEALGGWGTLPEELEKLHEAATRYRAYKHWDHIPLGASERPITGKGFNAVKFDPRKPARTIPLLIPPVGRMAKISRLRL